MKNGKWLLGRHKLFHKQCRWNDGVYTFHIETQDGQSAGVITVDSQTGEMNTEEFEIPEESDEDMYSDLNAYDMESFDYDMESFDF